MYKFCKTISAIFSPLLVPTWAMILVSNLSVLSILPGRSLWATIGVVFLITAIIPAVGILTLQRVGVVTDPGLNNRSERSYPYMIVMLCYGVCAYFLSHAGAPAWLPLFFLGALAASFINLVVNRWWKISAHAAAMAGLIVMLFRLVAVHQNIVSLDGWITGAVLATGLVMTARIYMGRHTLLQVLAGALNGALCVLIISSL